MNSVTIGYRGDGMKKRLYKSTKDKMIDGVCGGLAEYFKIDATIVRLLAVILALSSLGVMVVGYIIAAIVIPEKPVGYVEDEEDVEVLDENGNTVEKRRDTRQVLGILFVCAGGLMILNRTISWFDTEILLAMAIIAAGLYVLIRRKEA